MTSYGIAQVIGFAVFLVGGLTLSSKAVWFVVSGAFVVLLIIQVCFVSPYQNAEKLQSQIEDYKETERIRRDNQSKRILDKVFRLLKRPSTITPYQALYIAGAAELETNAQLVEMAGKISEHHEHPLLWMQKYVVEDEWLSFFQWGKRHPDFNFEKVDDYLQGVGQWGIEHQRATEESIAKEIIAGMTDRGMREISSLSDQT